MQRAAQNFIRKFLKKYSFSQNGKSLNQHQKQSFRDVLSKRCSQKFNKIHRKTRGRLSFLIKLQGSACSFINKETLAQVFSYEFWEISKNTFLHRAPLVAASAAFCFFFSIFKYLTYSRLENGVCSLSSKQVFLRISQYSH